MNMPSLQMGKNKSNLAFIFLTLFLVIFAKPIYGTTDDYILNSWLNGSYTGNHEKESIFITSIFSNLISSIYNFYPNVSWYPIFLLLVTLASIMKLNQFISKKSEISKTLKYFNFIVLAAYLTWSVFGITYTATAIIAGVAGWVSIKEWLINDRKQTLIIAFIFVVLSIIIRPESFLGATLIVYPFILFKIKINKTKILKIFLFSSLVLTVLLINRITESAFSSEMKDYRDWAKKVQMFAGRPRMDAATRVIGNPGWTTSEYNLFVDLAYFDKNNFNLNWINQGIKATDEISNRPNLNFEKFRGITDEYFQSLIFFEYLFMFIFLIIIYSMRKAKFRGIILFVFLNFILIHVFSGLFLHNVSRVTIPFLIVLFFVLSQFITLDIKNKYLVPASSFLALAFVAFFVQQNNLNNIKIKTFEEYRNSIVTGQKDKIVLIHGNQEYFQNSNPFLAVTKDLDPNVFMVGNWDTFSPQWFKRAKLVGLDENNLIDSLITNPNVYWSGPTVPDTTLNLINYLNESGYGVFEPVKVGLLPNGNQLWKFAKSGVSSES
jgi:K+-sensing histidine kinase KdpD